MPMNGSRLTRSFLSTPLNRIALLRRDLEQALAEDVRGTLSRIDEYATAATRAGRSGAAAQPS